MVLGAVGALALGCTASSRQGALLTLRQLRWAAWGVLASVLAAFITLEFAFYTNDFSMAYVAQHAHSRLPVAYRLAAAWGGHEGSLLLWALLLAGWMALVAWRGCAGCVGSAGCDGVDMAGKDAAMLLARTVGVLAWLVFALVALILYGSNPFVPLPAPVSEGMDLHPLLQDPLLAWHPPLLYLGYAGLAVPFAVAIAVLRSAQPGTAWADGMRPWVLWAWAWLTLGIATGSQWAYAELGWGGWWFWDPVENASLVPWLLGTALLHSLLVTRSAGKGARWTVLLAIAAFATTLLGTFLVRSGVLMSVHAFAMDPGRGMALLVVLTLVVGGALGLYGLGAGRLPPDGVLPWRSREAVLLALVLLLCVAAGTVLLGTLYPMVLDALGVGRISVGPPYFERVMAPLMALVVVLMVPGAVMQPGTQTPTPWNWRWPALGAALSWGCLWAGGATPVVAGVMTLAVWVVATPMVHAWKSRRWTLGTGAQLAHAGVVVSMVGMTMSGTYGEEHDVRMRAGDALPMGGGVLRFVQWERHSGPNYRGYAADFVWEEPGRAPVALRSERRGYGYEGAASIVTEASIDRNGMRDVVVALREQVDAGQAWVLRVAYQPFVAWIWLGCWMMAAGSVWGTWRTVHAGDKP
ncbi:cytochrome c-type biogenesis protein CcmF [Candidatus Symbiobacter mobilis CR]|uniref:Cytochrome c-type biogenesis protein CcmF n=1 Tax=Candidatus Symbiobacter mobilis CR TaxID=946483 RepID=U5N972_9BURK|nr:cytochrome c-type biogenesis protein CcmF [Candidatus Symbiobacter mobilis CR]